MTKKLWCYGKQDLHKTEDCHKCKYPETCYNLTFKDYFEKEERGKTECI